VRVAVIGLGSAGSRHAEHLVALGHDVLGYDPGSPPTPENVRRVEDLEAALGDAQAAVIASPNVDHRDQALSALAAGCHVLVEKPLALNAGDAARIASAAHSASRVCGVAMNLRFHPGLLTLRSLLIAGALGRPLLSHISFGFDLRLWRPNSDYTRSYSARAELGGGILLDAIHELDYLLWLLGPGRAVTARLDRLSQLKLDVEDTVLATVELASGALATVDLNFFEPSYRRACRIVGEGAVAHWDWRTRTVEITGEDAHLVDVSCDLSECYRAVVVDFTEAIEQGRPTRASANEGVATLILADAIRRSSATGRRVELAL